MQHFRKAARLCAVVLVCLLLAASLSSCLFLRLSGWSPYRPDVTKPGFYDSTEPLDPSERSTTSGSSRQGSVAFRVLTDLYALEEGEALPGEYTLTGIVQSIDVPYSALYQNLSCVIVVEEQAEMPVYCDRLHGVGVSGLQAGDTVTVTGVLQYKNGNRGFAPGCAAIGDQTDPVYTEPWQIVYAAYELPRGAVLSGVYTLTGVVQYVETPYAQRTGSVTLDVVVEDLEDKPIRCASLQGEGVERLRTGDTVTVSGTLQNRGGVIGFVPGCTLVSYEKGPLPPADVEENASYETLGAVAQEKKLTAGLPSVGDVEVLVIPIGFTNKTYTNVREKLEIGFNGTPEQTGWHSLRSYYQEVSYGALNIHATITDVYQTGQRYDVRRGETNTEDYQYLASALQHFDGSIDYSRYDANGDGYVDCVYLVYLAPYGTGERDSDLWWAYTYEYFESGEEMRLDGMGIDWYMWFSIDFFDDPILNDGYHTERLGVTVNAETVIHETGHAMGLDDYYDYVNQKLGGLGALNMMDANQGDHDPFSKALLGWIHPTVLKSGAYEKELRSFAATGDALFIAREGNGSYFDEFFVLCFYTPDGVNALKAGKNIGIPGRSGIVVYHVNATLSGAGDSIIDIYAHNNGEEVDRLIKIVEAKGNDIDRGNDFSDSDLFTEGKTLPLVWNDGTSAELTLVVDSIGQESAVVTVS